ncbi:MAG: hypothetical protein RIS44_931 [Pseudomonadota bacterium]|jgi:hypothetical protein
MARPKAGLGEGAQLEDYLSVSVFGLRFSNPRA